MTAMNPCFEGELLRLHERKAELTIDEIVSLLELQGDGLKILYKTADRLRHDTVGDAIFIRGILEFSNHCRKNCNYCGIRAGNSHVERYRMSAGEIANLAHQARHYGCTTVVLQSGEDPAFTCEEFCQIIHRIKLIPNMAVTLSIGEWSKGEYAAFKAAGCDRFLLRFETSDRETFQALHPDDDFDQRIQCLQDLRDVDIQVGSGFLIGLPHKGVELIAKDILFATQLDLDMIGCGPFVAHPDTPLACKPLLEDKEVYFKAIAILRLLNPHAHIPATTAYDAIFKFGRDRVLQRGANVFMPNLTPQRYRDKYQLYPNKPCVDEDADQCAQCTLARVLRLGRKLGKGVGHSLRPEWRAAHRTK